MNNSERAKRTLRNEVARLTTELTYAAGVRVKLEELNEDLQRKNVATGEALDASLRKIADLRGLLREERAKVLREERANGFLREERAKVLREERAKKNASVGPRSDSEPVWPIVVTVTVDRPVTP